MAYIGLTLLLHGSILGVVLLYIASLPALVGEEIDPECTESSHSKK